MQLTDPIERPNLPTKLQKSYRRYVQLIDAINDKTVLDSFTSEVNPWIEGINGLADKDPVLAKVIRKTRSNLLNKAIKDLKLVPKSYYQTLWMTLGMTVFGVPFGIMFGSALDNFGFFAIGLPIGMSIGIAIGAGLDKKAAQEGRQLSIRVG